jgi:hypothetical protein
LSPYSLFKDGRPAGNMAKCGSVQCDSVCACEGYHTIGNSSPVGGNACNITEIRKY